MGSGVSTAQKGEGSITLWLAAQNEAFRKYAKLFIGDGYETVALLAQQRDRAEIQALLAGHKKVKRVHANAILLAYDALGGAEKTTKTTYSDNTNQSGGSSAAAVSSTLGAGSSSSPPSSQPPLPAEASSSPSSIPRRWNRLPPGCLPGSRSRFGRGSLRRKPCGRGRARSGTA